MATKVGPPFNKNIPPGIRRDFSLKFCQKQSALFAPFRARKGYFIEWITV
jgi:hypothetical protein